MTELNNLRIILLIQLIVHSLSLLTNLPMSEEWKPVDSQVLVDAWEEIKDCAEGIQKDLACPDETISKMLRSVAETFDNTVEDICLLYTSPSPRD